MERQFLARQVVTRESEWSRHAREMRAFQDENVQRPAGLCYELYRANGLSVWDQNSKDFGTGMKMFVCACIVVHAIPPGLVARQHPIGHGCACMIATAVACPKGSRVQTKGQWQ